MLEAENVTLEFLNTRNFSLCSGAILLKKEGNVIKKKYQEIGKNIVCTL